MNWDSVPSKYNPEIEKLTLDLKGVKRIHMKLLISGNIALRYSNELSRDSAYLKIYSVWFERASWANLQSTPDGESLKLSHILLPNPPLFLPFVCEIGIHNKEITHLKGGCYVYAEIILPANDALIEVYNGDKLISKRFFPMDNKMFLESLDKSSFAENTFALALIDEYVSSYGTNRPQLTTDEFSLVLESFSWPWDELKVLRKLHEYISDRENLEEMIEDEFSLGDQEEAKIIVGLLP